MIVFAHVPKTAGTSVTGVLMRFLVRAAAATPSQMLLYGVRIPYTDLAPLERLPGDIRLVTGHFRAPHYEKLMPLDPFIVASTRDPFERFCSGLEHVQRLLSTDEFPAKPEMLEKSGRLLDELIEARSQRDGTLAALVRYRNFEQRGSRRNLVHEGRFVAKARIESTEIDRLCQMLAAAVPGQPDLLPLLRSVNRQNVWPRVFFNAFTDSDLAVLQECFTEIFADEVRLTAAFRQEIRSVFEPDLWQTFIDGLLQPVAAAA
jgi:hypothetical protein